MNAATVFAAALVTAVATGLGAAPFFAAHSVSRRWLGISNAAAAGFMLAASAVLAWQGVSGGAIRVLLGAALGVAFIAAVQRLLAGRDLHVGALAGADALKAITIVAVMTAHSLTEGVGVGVSFGDGADLGVFVTAAIAIHNVPEGLAISLVLVPRGTRPVAAAWWCVFSSLPQPLLAVPAFAAVETFRPILPAGLGFAAGAMAWLTLTQLVPDARANATPRAVAAGLSVSFVAMMALQGILLRI
jgi:zinc transporter ZupT